MIAATIQPTAVRPELSGPCPSVCGNSACGNPNSCYEPMMLVTTTNTTTCRMLGKATIRTVDSAG